MAIPVENHKVEDLPIIIAGGGCVGLFLALLLTHSAVPNRVLVIETHHPDPSCTRAMAHQPHTFPLFAQIPGLLPELINAGSLSSGLCFRTSVKNGSRVIASKTFQNDGEGIKGKGQLLLPQGKFQQVLMQRLAESEGRAEVRLGWSVDGFEQKDDRVCVRVVSTHPSQPCSPSTVPQPEPAQQSIDACFLIGADGAHSLVRKAMGLDLDGETLDAQLVATDLRFPFHSHGFMDANFIVDPSDYGLVGRIDDQGLWRVSYGVPGEMSETQIQHTVREEVRRMLPAGGTDEHGTDAFEIVRVAPYKAQQRCASTLVQGRVLILGDAAHLTNPYAGLGLAAGIADADALAPVLARVLTGKAASSAKLLASWSEARRRVFFEAVDRPSRAAYTRVRSEAATEADVAILLARDPAVGALHRGVPMLPVGLRSQGEGMEGW